MKFKGFILFIAVLFSYTLQAQDNGIYIKDTVLFNALLANGVDKDTNNIITPEEANAVDTLILKDLKLRKLDIIKHFEGLKYLDCSRNKIEELDLSSNPFLEELDCSYNRLKSLNLAMNAEVHNLTTKNNYPSLYVIYHFHDESIYKQQIPIPDKALLNALLEIGLDANEDGQISFEESERVNSLNLAKKGITNLEGLQHFRNLMQLDLSENKLVEAELHGLYELQNLNLFKNQLTSLSLNKLKKLKYLTTSFNAIENIDVSENTHLVYLNVTANKLSVLNVWKNPDLKQIKSSGNNPNLKIHYTKPVPLTKKAIKARQKVIKAKKKKQMKQEKKAARKLGPSAL